MVYNTVLWSFVAQLVAHGAYNARVVGLISTGDQYGIVCTNCLL